MLTIDITTAEAEEALVRLAEHVPAAVKLGRPRVARRDPETGGVQFLTTAGLLWIASDGADRLLYNDDGEMEASSWRNGVCVAVNFGDTRR